MVLSLRSVDGALKPDNVFVIAQGEGARRKELVKIVDFGIAKAVEGPLLSSMTPGGTLEAPPELPLDSYSTGGTSGQTNTQGDTAAESIVGTPIYMAPEQVRGRELDFRVDQYALGCMFFQMLTGTVPFESSNATDTMMRHLFDPVPTLRQRRPELKVRDSLEALVARLMQKTAAARFDSMHQVEEAIEHEIELMQIERGEKTVLPTALAGLVGRGEDDKGSYLMVGGRRLRLWSVIPMALLLVLGGGLIAYQALRPESAQLRPGELQELRLAAMKVLDEGLRSPAKDLRLSALSALGQSRDPAQRGRLEAFLSSADPDQQAQAVDALAALGERAAIPALTAALDRSTDGTMRGAIAVALEQLGAERGETLLHQMLESTEQETRLRAALLMCEHGPPAAQQLLAQLAKQESAAPATRQGALFCLAQSPDAQLRGEARAKLAGRLASKGPTAERATVAARLAQVGDELGRDFLRSLARRPGPDQLVAARLIAGPDEPELAELFRRVAKQAKADAAARVLAAEGLGLNGELFDARLLGKLLPADTASALRQAAAASIVQLAALDPSRLSEQSLSWARGALQDRSLLMRQAAVAVLADSGSPDAVALLRQLFGDKEARVRQSVARALGRRGDRALLPVLQAGFSDADPAVREESLLALGRLSAAVRKQAPAEAAAVLSQVTGWVKELRTRGTVKEQILAASALLQLGDGGQLEALRRWQTAADAELRQLVVEQARGDQGLLSAGLKDGSFAVRFAAARQLAARGDRAAVPVLQEALGHGEPEALIAHGLLGRLGEKSAAPKDGESVWSDGEPRRRLQLIESLASASPEVAVPLLLRATHEPDPELRRAAAESADAVAASGGTAALQVLRRLLGDEDPGVRALASALLSRRTGVSQPASPAGAASAPQAPEPVQAAPQPPTRAEPPAAPPDLGSAQSVDAGDAPAADAPDGTDAGDAKAGAEDALPGKAAAEDGRSLAEQLFQNGMDSAARRDFRKAQRQLEKAILLCVRDRKAAPSCPSLLAEAALRLGQLHEDQKELGEAMAEYQRVLGQGGGKFAAKPSAATRARAVQAVQRLFPQLGQVVVAKQQKGKCVQAVIWLQPGTHMVRLGTKFETIQVKANDKVAVGSCDG